MGGGWGDAHLDGLPDVPLGRRGHARARGLAEAAAVGGNACSTASVQGGAGRWSRGRGDLHAQRAAQFAQARPRSGLQTHSAPAGGHRYRALFYAEENDASFGRVTL